MRLLLLVSLLGGCSFSLHTDGEDLIDGILLPDPTGVEWADTVDNPYFPLPVGARWSYAAETEEGTETDEVQVLDETRDVNGVQATVVHDQVFLDGELIEDTYDWYAQDEEGNVWYLGEDSCEFEDGDCVSTEGSWEWGVDGAEPGIVMWADPEVTGQPYFQEYYEGEAEDVGEVIATGESITVPAGSFDDCIRTADTSHIEDVHEEKVYCPGVGNVYVEEEDAEVFLVSVQGVPGSSPSP